MNKEALTCDCAMDCTVGCTGAIINLGGCGGGGVISRADCLFVSDGCISVAGKCALCGVFTSAMRSATDAPIL